MLFNKLDVVRYNVFNKSMELIMARSTVQTSTRVLLDLNEDEARYLSDVLQNCPLGTTPETEEELHRECRSAIWCELNNCLKINHLR
jgi:hypothetical protein